MNEVPVELKAEREKVKQTLRLGAHLLVLISGVSLLLTQKLWISASILLIACAVAFVVARRPRGTTFWEFASFLYLIFFFADWFWITRSLAPSLVHLFIFIIINKLFNLNTDRDYYQLYLLTFLSMLAATALSIEIVMLYMIVLFVLLFVWNILSITLIKVWSKSDPPEPFPFSLFHYRYWAFVVLSAVGMIVIALGIFFLLPRAQLGYFSGLNPGRTQHVSGFSQKVELGDIAEIQENTDEVMRISLSGAPVPVGYRMYWRGMAFDRYDGKAWSTSNPGTSFLFQDSSNTFYVSTDRSPAALTKQEVYLSPIDSRVIFGLDRIVKVEGNFFGVSRDVNGSLAAMGRPQKYDVYSHFLTINEERLRSRSISYSENVIRYYTKLQDRNPRIDSLAKEITAGTTNVYDRVQRVQAYLEKNYAYSTTNLPLDDQDPVSHFLFKRKVGHCEYFATSMVILLRHLGIPSRIVNGFLQGEYNELGKFYVVRQSDAHSWVEVYFGNGIWHSFDPSPRFVQSTGSGGSFWRIFNPRKVLDSIAFFWDRYILIFSAEDQINSLQYLEDRYRSLKRKLRKQTRKATAPDASWRPLWGRYRTPLLGFLISVVFLYYSIQFYKARRRKMELTRSPVLFYHEMLMLLDRRGFVKPVSSTPSEFAHQVSDSLPAPSNVDVNNLTELFYKARFGNYSLTREDQQYVESALSRLQNGK